MRPIFCLILKVKFRCALRGAPIRSAEQGLAAGQTGSFIFFSRGPLPNGLRRAEPSRAEPSRAEPSRAEPRRGAEQRRTWVRLSPLSCVSKGGGVGGGQGGCRDRTTASDHPAKENGVIKELHGHYNQDVRTFTVGGWVVGTALKLSPTCKKINNNNKRIHS